MDTELRNMPPNLTALYYEWNIACTQASLFTLFDCRFDKIVLLLGEESAYWIFYQTVPLHRRVEGYGPILVPYCCCCFHSHYLQVLNSVRKLIRDHYDYQ